MTRCSYRRQTLSVESTRSLPKVADYSHFFSDKICCSRKKMTKKCHYYNSFRVGWCWLTANKRKILLSYIVKFCTVLWPHADSVQLLCLWRNLFWWGVKRFKLFRCVLLVLDSNWSRHALVVADSSSDIST